MHATEASNLPYGLFAFGTWEGGKIAPQIKKGRTLELWLDKRHRIVVLTLFAAYKAPRGARSRSELATCTHLARHLSETLETRSLRTSLQ